MPKSVQKKYNDLTTRKRDNSKRLNPDRGKHGCSRLHELKAQREQEQIRAAEPVVEIKSPVKTSLMGKMKAKLSSIWK
jgi:hypothetical protein